MKIRQGFVSNSSSSSFVFVTTVENHNRVMATMSGDVKTFLDNFPFEKGKFFGKDVVMFGDVCGNGEDGTLYWTMEDVRRETLVKWDSIEDVMDNYQKEAEKNKDECFSWDG